MDSTNGNDHSLREITRDRVEKPIITSIVAIFAISVGFLFVVVILFSMGVSFFKKDNDGYYGDDNTVEANTLEIGSKTEATQIIAEEEEYYESIFMLFEGNI